MASLGDIRSRLAVVQATVTGVKRAFARAPKNLAGPDLPCVVNFAGPAQLDSLGDGYHMETREMVMRLYAGPAQTGLDGETETTCETLMDALRAKFSGGLAVDAGLVTLDVQVADYIGDRGIGVAEFAGQAYVAADCVLRIARIVSD